jgi:hypothetical protein
MQHLVATVMRSARTGPVSRAAGLTVAPTRLSVRIEGPVSKALSVPEGIVGRELVITRDVPTLWRPRRGDPVVLSAAESARVLRPRRRPRAGPPIAPAAARLEVCDIDRDGFREDIFVNAFVEAVVQPHRGGRLLSLRDARGHDRFAQPDAYIMEGKYILLGGAEDIVVESGRPGELWKAALEREADEGAVSVRYERTLKSPKNLRFIKRVGTDGAFPGVFIEVDIVSAGRGAPEGRAASGEDAGTDDGTKDTTAASYALRLSTALHGKDALNLFDVPGPRGVRVERFHRPAHGSRWRWRDWRNERFGLRGGFLVSRHEELGRPLMMVFSPRRMLCLSMLNDYTGPEIVARHRPASLAPASRRRYGVAFVAGEASASVGSSALIVSRGRGGDTVAVTVRTGRRVDRLTARLRTAGGLRRLTLRPRELPGAGRLYVGTLSGRDLRKAFACRVRAGSDALAVDVEAA